MDRKMEARLPARRSSPLAAEARRRFRKQAQRIATTLTPQLAALVLASALTSPAHALTLQEQGWQVANAKCLGGDAKQCELREQLSGALKRKGCVFQEDGGWWKCSRGH